MRLTAAALLGMLLAWGCGTPPQNEVLATVGAESITAGEFQERYANYMAATPTRDNILLRKKILENMVNEAILFEEISRRGLDRDTIARSALEKMRTQALLVAAAKSITVDTMTITEQELMDEFRAFNTKIAARFVYGKSLAEARAMKERIERGDSFEALAKERFDDPGLAANGGYLGYFGYGDMEPAFEAAANALPVGGISEPVRLSMGYAIIKVENKVAQPLPSESDFIKVRDKLARSIQERKAMDLLTGATHAMAGALGERFHEEPLARLFAYWDAIRAGGEGGAERALADGLERDAQLVDIAGGGWTVGEFLERLSWTTPGQRSQVRTPEELKDLVRALATRQKLLDEARKKGLDRTPGYLKTVEAKTAEYLLKRWAAIVQDSAANAAGPEGELREYYERNRGLYARPPERNVAEILVRTEAEARTLASEVAKGKDFSDLARRKSIRLWAAKNRGELGFGTRSTFGILGDKFFAAPVGSVVGPEKVDPYFGVFKILAAREGRSRSFEEAREDVERDVGFLRKQEAFKQRVAELRGAASVEIFEDRLASVAIQ